ncbi:hypothetical protein D9756_008607 [Leucocoprinus leucothites]|uniref:NACHT domain-containing protein n=1 Tax=Leucocoprinus leucothites TaxID=201217 RepID=A0A8H5CZL7_9AGAR|nr:hypothetical protein D9756_008607 [Leucoagaricus leucothites]
MASASVIIQLSHPDHHHLNSSSMFNNSSNFRIDGGNFVIQCNSVQSGIDKLYQYCTPDAAHDSYARRSRTCCFEGTRTMYIQGITDWGTSSDESRPRLFWMWGPAGVGKTAIAQSCAKEATAHGVLGATFFFSRDNGVVSPAYFFTTIAYQLALQLDDYKAILGIKIQRNPAILTKGLGAQLQELIIAPFLQLEGRNLRPQPRIVFIDGLDECNDDSAQAEMVELVASSVAQYGSRIPLLWAFFSRPERHIERTFSRYSVSPLFWLIKLPITRNGDPDIRLFLRASLKLPGGSTLDPSSGTSVWLSEEDLSTLVQMVAGLFIYAAVIVKFIMDPDALSPQRQLQDVLSVFSDRMHMTQFNEQESPLAGLDAFYRMIMSRIPEKILPIVQQILLVQTKWDLFHQASKSPLVRLLANLFRLSLQEFENCFSKLSSVPTFKEYMLSESERGKDGWPGSLMVVFYHASFLEFLRDQRRSGKYWIENQRHWSSLAVKGLRLLKDIYATNGLSQDKKIRELRKILPVCLGDIPIPDQHFQFRDELCLGFLYRNIPVWCESSGYADEVIEELYHTDYAMLARLEARLGVDKPISWRQFPENIRLGDPHWKVSHRRPPDPCNGSLLNSSANIESILRYIASVLEIPTEIISRLGSIHELNDLIQSKVVDYFSSYVQDVLEVARKIDFEALDMFDLLEYYYYEWRQFRSHYYIITSNHYALETIRRAALLPWEKNFLSVLQGTENRLTNAALARLKQLRDRDLLNRDARAALLEFFEFTDDPSSSSYHAAHVESAVLQATIEYYTTERPHVLLSDDIPLSNFKRIASRLGDEQYLHRPSHPFHSRSVMMRLCTDTLLKDHREEVCKEFAVYLTTGNYENISWVLRAMAWSAVATDRLLMIFKAHAKKMAFDAIVSANGDGVPSLKDSGDFEQNLVSILRQNLLLIEMSLETDGTKYCVPDHYAHKFRDNVEEVLEEILNEYPQWRGSASDYDTDWEENDWEESPDSDGEESGLGRSSSAHSRDFASYEDNLGDRQFPHQPQPSAGSSVPLLIHTPGADECLSQLGTQASGTVGDPILEDSASYQNPAGNATFVQYASRRRVSMVFARWTCSVRNYWAKAQRAFPPGKGGTKD